MSEMTQVMPIHHPQGPFGSLGGLLAHCYRTVGSDWQLKRTPLKQIPAAGLSALAPLQCKEAK